MPLALTRWLIGRPVANRDAETLKLGTFSGIPAMGLDGLGSAAYGPEAALAVLVAAGTTGVAYVQPILWVILLLLGVLWMSYRQTISAYPNNGGAYVVARENLGTLAGLSAAAALMIDYMLNVAVGISAGVAALVSLFPSLQPATLWICLGLLAAITTVNLRGTRESGVAFAVPTYLFVASLALLIGFGAWRALHGQPPVVPPPAPAQAGGVVGLWLLMRAFAAGCTAMTGVEAVSNGVGAFADPRERNAHRTLSGIVLILAVLLAGIGALAAHWDLAAMDQTKPGYQSVLSQLAAAVAGRGVAYDIAMASVVAVLCLSANTSFVGFPRLCRLAAEDGFLPRAFAVPGRRLVYSAGVLFLAAGSGGLLIAFDGITDRLIPLFAVGAFLSFTLSQAGMAAHWRRERRWGKRLVNGVGAIATAVALGIILVAKFAEGAWITVLVIPLVVLLLRAIGRYYDDLDRNLLTGARRRIDLSAEAGTLALVPIKRWDLLARKAVEHALRLADDVTALHVVDVDGPDAKDNVDTLEARWRDYVEEPAARAGLRAPILVLAPSPYRSVVAPLLRAIENVRANAAKRPILVVLPELVEAGSWTWLMHVHRERNLRAKLLRFCGSGVSVVSVPWQIEPRAPREGVAEEEAG